MKLRSQRFGIEVELTAYIAKTRARIHEMPISYYPRTTAAGQEDQLERWDRSAWAPGQVQYFY